MRVRGGAVCIAAGGLLWLGPVIHAVGRSFADSGGGGGDGAQGDGSQGDGSQGGGSQGGGSQGGADTEGATKKDDKADDGHPWGSAVLIGAVAAASSILSFLAGLLFATCRKNGGSGRSTELGAASYAVLPGSNAI